jgi:ferredoxin
MWGARRCQLISQVRATVHELTIRQREDGVSQVIGQPSTEQVAAVREAWDACPVVAIEISED